MSLIKEIEEQLPLPVYPTPELCQVLRKRGVEIGPDKELEATEVFDSGDAGGIVCSIVEGDQVFVVSLTHLRVKTDPPLSQKISDYQRRRIERLLKDY